MSSQNSGVLFFAGLVVGGLVGAGLALLLAPQSGEETRSQIKDKSFELKDGAVEGLAEAGQRAQRFDALADGRAQQLDRVRIPAH